MIYTRFGGTVTMLRIPTVADVLKYDAPLDDEAKINLACKSWVLVELDSGPRIVRFSELVADEGLKEIATALDGVCDTWECPDCRQTWPRDERCHTEKCRAIQDRRLKRWRERSA